MHVAAIVMLSVVVRSGPVRTAMNGTLVARPAGGQSPGWAQESSYAAATRLGTTMRHASTTSSRISAWSIASSHTRTQL